MHPLLFHILECNHNIQNEVAITSWVYYNSLACLILRQDIAVCLQVSHNNSSQKHDEYQYVITEKISYSANLALPWSSANSIRKDTPTTFPFSFSTSLHAAQAVPPVAIKSSNTRARSPSLMASLCIWISSSPEKRCYAHLRPCGSTDSPR